MKTFIDKLLMSSKLLSSSFIPPKEKWQGAVCFLIVEDSLFLINRAQTMPIHKGQISFVGGHKKKEEDSPVETCLREFEEETGMNSSYLTIHCQLEAVQTLNHQIIPIICTLNMTKKEFIRVVKSNGEWSSGILYPIKDLLDSSKWSFAQILNDSYSYRVSFFSLERRKALIAGDLDDNDFCLWGASAKMILKFLGI
jgi:hypothetical protein